MTNPGLFRNVRLFTTKITFIVAYQLPQNEPSERLSQILSAFDLQSQRIEILLYFFGLFAVVAAEKIGSFSSIEIIDESSEGVFLDADLKPIEEHGDKLLHVLLHHDIDRFPKRLVGDTKGRGGKVQTRRPLKIPKDALDLVKDVIVDQPLL